MYGCSNINEFKQKSKIYEKLRFDYESVKSHKNETDSSPETTPETVIMNMSTPLKSNACAATTVVAIILRTLIVLIQIKTSLFSSD